MSYVHSVDTVLFSGPLHRLRQRSALGPSRDGHHYAVVHCTGYIKNWPPSGVPMDRGVDDDSHSGSHCCLVAIGRLQVTSTPNTSDLVGSNSAAEFISRHSADGKFTFVDQKIYVHSICSAILPLNCSAKSASIYFTQKMSAI